MKTKKLLLYGKAPEWLGYDEDYVLIEAQAAERLVAASRCRTWGAFAELLGYPFDRMLDVWGAQMREANENILPDADTPLHFASVWGVWDIGDLIADPRVAAVEALPKNIDWESHPALTEVLQTTDEGMTTDGGALLSSSNDGFASLSHILNDQGFDQFEIKQDDAFVFDTFSWLHSR